MDDLPLMLRISAARQLQIGENESVIISATQAEAEQRIANWEAFIADNTWDELWPIVQIMTLDYLAMAHLDRCRWEVSPSDRARALAAWRSMMAAYPENLATRSCFRMIEGLDAAQVVSREAMRAIAAGSSARIELKQPATQRMAIGYAGEPLRALQRP